MHCRMNCVGMLSVGFLMAGSLCAGPFSFTTGAPDGRMGMASRAAGNGLIEIETADDFILASQTFLTNGSFTGLLPSSAPLSSLNFVGVEIYRIFPLDSGPASGNVPTRVNSPSDVAFDSRDSGAGNLTFTALVVNSSFTASNSIVNGINKVPGQTTGGEGAVRGEEVTIDVNFTTPFLLDPGHYFIVPLVGLSNGTFLWLSTPAPPVFTGDLQAWIRNENLDPDWLRAGTDIVGGATPPRFNASFSVTGETVPEPSSALLLLAGLVPVAWRLRRR